MTRPSASLAHGRRPWRTSIISPASQNRSPLRHHGVQSARGSVRRLDGAGLACDHRSRRQRRRDICRMRHGRLHRIVRFAAAWREPVCSVRDACVSFVAEPLALTPRVHRSDTTRHHRRSHLSAWSSPTTMVTVTTASLFLVGRAARNPWLLTPTSRTARAQDRRAWHSSVRRPSPAVASGSVSATMTRSTFTSTFHIRPFWIPRVRAAAPEFRQRPTDARALTEPAHSLCCLSARRALRTCGPS